MDNPNQTRLFPGRNALAARPDARANVVAGCGELADDRLRKPIHRARGV